MVAGFGLAEVRGKGPFGSRVPGESPPNICEACARRNVVVSRNSVRPPAVNVAVVWGSGDHSHGEAPGLGDFSGCYVASETTRFGSLTECRQGKWNAAHPTKHSPSHPIMRDGTVEASSNAALVRPGAIPVSWRTAREGDCDATFHRLAWAKCPASVPECGSAAARLWQPHKGRDRLPSTASQTRAVVVAVKEEGPQ
jgi:hypothetical protein